MLRAGGGGGYGDEKGITYRFSLKRCVGRGGGFAVAWVVRNGLGVERGWRGLGKIGQEKGESRKWGKGGGKWPRNGVYTLVMIFPWLEYPF